MIAPDRFELMLEVALLAEQTGRLIMNYYTHSDFNVSHKIDASPVTCADLAAHDLIAETLARLTPDIPLLSEEGRLLDFDTRQQWKRYWLVDPLDGTKGFLAKTGEFTVNIALIENQEPVLSALYVPVQEICYFAAKGMGTFRRPLGQDKQRLTTRPHDAAHLVAVTPRSRHDHRLEQLLCDLSIKTRLEANSSIKFAMIAEGLGDFYARCSPLSEWDTGAGHALITEAGGVVLDLSFNPLRYNTNPSIICPGFLVLGDPKLLPIVQRILESL